MVSSYDFFIPSFTDSVLGARNLIILSRSAMDKQHTPFMKELESYPGLTLTLVSGDAGEYKNVLAAICKAPKPVAGIMQLSLVLKVFQPCSFPIIL